MAKLIDPVAMNSKQMLDALYARAHPDKQVYGFALSAGSETVVKAPRDWQLYKKGISIQFNAHAAKEVEPNLHTTDNKAGINFKSSENLMNAFTSKVVDDANSPAFIAAAKLSSYIEASSGDSSIVQDVVDAIYGEDAPQIAPFMPNMGDSWNVRALVSSSKAHHQIFGESNEVGKVSVDLKAYSKRDDQEAVDWARAIVASKYLGVVNMLYDKTNTTLIPIMFACFPDKNNPIMPKSSFQFSVNFEIIKRIPRKHAFLEMIQDEDTMVAKVLEQTESMKKIAKKIGSLQDHFIEAAKRLAMTKLQHTKDMRILKKKRYENPSDTLLEQKSETVIWREYKETYTTDYWRIAGNRLTDLFIYEKNVTDFMANLRSYNEFTASKDLIDKLQAAAQMFFTPHTLNYMASRLSKMGYENVHVDLLRRWGHLASSPIDIGEKKYYGAITRLAMTDPDKLVEFFKTAWMKHLQGAYNFSIPKFNNDPEVNLKLLIEGTERQFRNITYYWENHYATKMKVSVLDEDFIKYQLLESVFRRVQLNGMICNDMLFDIQGVHEDHFFVSAARNYGRKRKWNLNLSFLESATTLRELGHLIDVAYKNEPYPTYEEMGDLIQLKLVQFRRDIYRYISLAGVDVQIEPERYVFNEGPFKTFKYLHVETALNPPVLIDINKANELRTLSHTPANEKEEVEEDKKEEEAPQTMLETPISFENLLGFDFSAPLNIEGIGTIKEAFATYPTDEEAEAYAKMLGYDNFQAFWDAHPQEDIVYYEPGRMMQIGILHSAYKNLAEEEEKIQKPDSFIQ